MKVLTVVSDPNDQGLLTLLIPSSSTFDLDLIVLITDQSNYRNHRYKDQALYRYLENVEDDEIILFTDGYDAMFVAGAEEILRKYHKTGKELLFSAERNCWPETSLAKKYPEEQSPFKYLCSGGFIGKAGYIKNRIAEKLETNSIIKYAFSNQIYWAEQFLRNQSEIGLDTRCEIFTTLSSELDFSVFKKSDDRVSVDDYNESKTKWFNANFSFKNGRIHVTQTGSTPCHIHVNGPSKFLARDIARNFDFFISKL
jgi:hypothetical protein